MADNLSRRWQDTQGVAPGTPAAPCYSPEWAGGAFAVLRDWMAPAVVGHGHIAGPADADSLTAAAGRGQRERRSRLLLVDGEPVADATVGEPYLIRVAGHDAESGDYALTLLVE